MIVPSKQVGERDTDYAQLRGDWAFRCRDAGLAGSGNLSLGRHAQPTRSMAPASRNSLGSTKVRSMRNDTRVAAPGRFPYRDARRDDGICTPARDAE
jgi:hypothetical protein